MPIPKSQPLRPSPLTPNNLELAILRRFADMEPSIQRHLACIRGNLSRLHVLSRKYTGFGSFTEFQMESLKKVAITSRVSLDLLVSVPGVPNGMGAVIHLKDGLPEALETFTYGEDHWDGTFEGFSIQGAQRPTADATISPLRGRSRADFHPNQTCCCIDLPYRRSLAKHALGVLSSPDFVTP